MPELADLIKTPDFLSFKDWEPQNDAGDPLKNRKSYAEYVRGEYLNAGSYNKVIEKEIQIATRDRAAEAGLINPESQEDVDKLFTSDEPDLDTKLTTIRSTLDSDSPEWRAANRYMTFKSMYPDIESLAPELAQSYGQYKQEAEQAAATGFDTAKRIKVRSGELPLAKVINEDGEEEIIGGAMMDAMKIPEAIRASKSGGISFSDALRVQSLASTPVGYKVPIYKAARYNEAAGMLSELAKNDEKTAKVIDDFSTSLSRADEDNREVFEAQKPDIAAVRRKLNESLTAGHTFTDDEIDNAVTQLAYFQANDQSKFKFYDDPKEIGRNIRNVGYGLPIVHPAVLVSKSRFEQAMAAHTEFSDEQREALTAQREIAAANSFDSYNKTLTQSTVSSDWLNALQIGRSNGQKDADTLEQFVSNPDNFNELSSRLGGIKESILDGFGELVAAVPTLMGADWARDYMVGNIKERQNRRETARLFGKEYGMGQDLGELIAPMLIDMAATTLLTTASAPVGGAAGLGYVAAKSGARITAKGLVKGLASGAFRQLPTETLEEAGQRLVTTGLVRESVGAVGTKGAMAAIEGYSGRLAKFVETGSVMAIPAFNRSAGSTYASVYSQLEGNKNLTAEERHDRALGAGLTAGAVTAALTAGFGAFGRGGLEDALLKGATRSELKSVMARIANVSDIDDEVFNKVIAKEVGSILKNYGSTLAKDAAKGFVDEGMEEGLDEFINGFITDAATEKNTPFLERLEQAGRAAILGGVMGAGVPAIRAAAAPMFQQSARDRQLAIEIDFAKKVSTSLAESGSPLTAETVYGILSAPRRTRARAAEAALQGSRQAAPATAIFSTPEGPPPPAAPAGPTPAGPTPAGPTPAAPAGPVEPTEVTPAEVTPAEVTLDEEAPTAAPAEVEGEAQYVAPTDLDVMNELLKTDITSAGELIDGVFGDKIVPTSYDPETQMITYVDDDGNEAETSLQSLDLTGNQEAIAKLRPNMPQTLAAVEKISAALHANTSPEVVAASIATDPDKAPDVGMDIDPIPNPVAKKNRKLAPKKNKSPVVEQLELKEQAAKKKATAPEGELNLQLSTPDKPPVKVPRARRSVKQQSKSPLAEQLGLDLLEEDVIEQSNHGGSVPDEEVVADAVVESTVTSIPIPVAEAVQAVVVGKKPKAVRVKKPKAPAVVAEAPLTFDEETFLDDEFTGQEISTLQRLIGYGFPVRLEAKALYGYPKRAQYDKGYLEGKSDLISRKIAEIYKPIAIGVQRNWTAVSGTKITALNPKTNKKSRIQPKGYINENGVGVFDNNPLTMMALMENNHPVVITEDFDINTINPAFRYSRLGTEYILTDIVKVNPESGSGFVSALQRQESTLTEEPDYDFIQKVSDFENLFDRRTAGEQMIPDPDSPSVMVKLSDVANRVTDLIRMGREPLQFQGSKERRVAGKSRAEAIAIIKNATKPTRATLTPEFQETAAIALDLAYRRAVRLYAMRLSFNKFSELKSGEAFPSLKPDKINAAISQFVGLTKPEGADQKVTIAKRLQRTFGSEIDPETNPDLVIANFIEKRILTTPEVAPTFRSVGSKVGNMYAGQQRTRNIYARRAVFQTTSPEDVTKLQAEREYNASLEVSDYSIAPDADLFSPTAQFTKALMERTTSDAVDSIDADPELRTALNKLLRSTLYKDNSAFDVSGLTSQDAFSQLAQWMSSGSYATNTEAIAFQRGLESGDYENGKTLRDALKLMHIASKSVTGTIDQDPDYISELARNLTASFGRTVTDKQAREFAKSIGQASTRLFSRSYVRGEQVEYARNLNNADAASLGLKSGDPQSVINALRIIAATDADPNKKLLARLLLENQPFIKQVAFSLDEVSAPYAGQFTVMADGSLAVSLNLNGYNGRGLADVLLHEYLHAFVNKVVSAPSDLQTSDQRAAIQRLNGILNLVRDAAAAKGIDSPMLTDGLASLNEFVAHFFTSTDFQNLVKTLTPPAKQRGFFARIIDAVLDVFGMGKSTQSVYQQAFTDVIDLTRSAIHSSPNTSKGLINKLSVRSSMLLERAKSVGTSFGAATAETAMSPEEEAAAIAADEAVVTQAEEAEAANLMTQVASDPLPFDPTTDTNATMREAMQRSMALIRKLVPKEIQLQWSADAPMAEVDLATGVMSVNPQNIAALIAGKTPAQAGLAIKTMIDEEMRHVASFNSLTQAEVDSIAAAKKDSDFEDIANQYYTNEANRAAALERLRSEDPDVSGVEKIRLVEERLRMLAQRVQRNTTTEEDYAFWRTNPSTLSILGRYFKNMLNSMFGNTTNINNNVASFVRGKTVLGMSADERVAVARIVVEMRALQAGYRLAPNAMRFNPENPSDVVGMFESQLGTAFGNVPSQLDEDYMKAVQAGDTATAQRMVDEAAKAAGYTSGPFFHGTDSEFDVFEKGGRVGLYFTPDEKLAKDYGKRVIKVYAKIAKGARVDAELTAMESSKKGYDALVKLLEVYDGLIAYPSKGGNQEVLLRDPNQIKSAEPITRDANGDVIPLSQRFNVKSSSILQTSFGGIEWSNDGIGATPTQMDIDYFGFVKTMSPEEFRSLVPKGNWDAKTIPFIKGQVAEGKKIAPPFLTATWKEEAKVWEVEDHEGRSRTDAATDLGATKIPVHIIPQRGMRARSITDEMRSAPFIPQNGGTPIKVGTSFGDVSQLPSRFDADKMDFSNFLEALEMPMLEVGTYRSPKNVLDRLFKGELDPRINTLKNHRDFFKTAAMSLVQNYKAKLDGIIKKDFGSLENAPLDDIAAAIGSTRGTILDEDVVNQIEDTYQAALETISIDDTLSAKDKTAARKVALDSKMQAVEAERVAQGDAIRVARDAALESLAKQSPELARHIVQLRTLTDEVSKRVSSLYGFKPELEATFDSQLGIYLTRSYKMFHEVGFADIVRSDPSYEPQRQAAMDFFADQFVKNEVERRVNAGELEADARAAALIELGIKASNGRTISENALEEFIAQYEKSGTYGVAGGATMSESFRVLQKNIKQKKDIPAPLRAILGEYGPESGTDNLLRSFVTVASMAANQSFLQNVKSIGVDGGWLMTRAQLDANQVADYETYKNYAPLRTAKVTTAYDPLGDLFGPPELVDGLNKVFSSEAQKQNMDTAQDWVANTTKTFAKLTGAAMAAKTLGSLGFYVRNIVSNVLFFGPSQGFFSLGKMAESARNEIWSTLTDPNQIDAYRVELTSLGVIGNELKASIMADLLRGTTTIQSVESQLDKLIQIGNAGTKPLVWITEKAQQLASAADAFYKIAYYENELKVLKSARDAGGGKFATMTDYELKREAARKVLMTAQSASQAPPLVKEITKSGIGLLLSPFLRFKTEVPRIVLNTYKLSFEEMRSGNPVIASRGQKRFAGMTFVVGGVSAIVPATLRALMGIGDDEDEALRASLPSYLRNHTFFYRRDDNGQLQSWNFTFLNPYSLIADPIMRSLELLFRGEPAKAAAKFVETAFFDQYLDDQIFSSAIQSLRDNRDPATEKPIYESKIDSTGAIIFKSLSHVFIQAYRPSVMTRAIKAYQAVGADYTDFDYSPMGILLQEVYPVKRHKIELDKQLRRYLSESRDVYNRINERKNVLFSQKPVDEDTIRDLLKSEVEDKAALNEDIYRKLRGYEGLGLKPQDSYSIMTSKNMGYGKDRSRLLFNKLMDRPVLTPDFQERLRNPENEQGLLRLQIAEDELRKYSRYLLLEP